MIRPLGLWLLFLAVSGSNALGASSQVGFELTAAPQRTDDLPYQSAMLALHNPADIPSQAVLLRCADGGPRLMFPAVVLPGRKERIPVALPAISQTQTYEIALLPSDDPTAAPLAQGRAEIHWPVERLNAGVFFAPRSYESLTGGLPQWDGDVRRLAFLLLALLSLALAAPALFRGSPVWLRITLSAAGLLLVGLSTAVLLSLRPLALDVQRTADQLILRTRRTTTATWSLPATGGYNAPIYSDERQWAGDDLVIHVGREASVTIRPEEVRIVRKFNGTGGREHE